MQFGKKELPNTGGKNQFNMVECKEKFKLIHVERAIKRRVKMSQDDLVNYRLDIGIEFLRNNFSEKRAARIWKLKSFWNWFIAIWSANDRQIMVDMENRGLQRLSVNGYLRIQRLKFNAYDLDPYLIT